MQDVFSCARVHHNCDTLPLALFCGLQFHSQMSFVYVACTTELTLPLDPAPITHLRKLIRVPFLADSLGGVIRRGPAQSRWLSHASAVVAYESPYLYLLLLRVILPVVCFSLLVPARRRRFAKLLPRQPLMCRPLVSSQFLRAAQLINLIVDASSRSLNFTTVLGSIPLRR